jgi:hypothetical protein
MRRQAPLPVALLALALSGLSAQAYDRELNSRQLREAYFLGKDTTFKLEDFLKEYLQELPVPEEGVHVQQVAIATPFKQMVDRSRRASPGYSPMKAEDQYREEPPPLTVEVTLYLTPGYPAHSPYTIPTFDPVVFRDPDFWQGFSVQLEQRGEIPQAAYYGRPLYDCDAFGGCWLVGAVVTAAYDPEQVASQPTTVVITGPTGQQEEVEFDLAKLR